MSRIARGFLIMARVKRTQPIKMVTTNSLKHDRVMAFEVTD